MKVTPVKAKFGKYRPGDAFDLHDPAARVLVKVGVLKEVLADYPEEVIEEVKALKAEETEEVKISSRTGKPVRQYKRRDMRAEA